MAKNLVIVESPTKVKTLQKYLGKDFRILASYGHVRDLIPKNGAVDTQQNFAMHYQVIERNQRHLQAIGNAMKGIEHLWLATDPDREGEAISWHIYQWLEQQQLLANCQVHRVVFHEITRQAVQQAIANPRELSQPLIDAQQTRRALDYLVGFNLSPLLWRKIHKGLSAGRVQSPALRMIVEREQAIEAFEQQEYWTVEAHTEKDQTPFKARLTHWQHQKLEQFSLNNEQVTQQACQQILQDSGQQLIVDEVSRKQRRRNPPPPFTTSTLQQEAARKLGFTTKRTMIVAQQLYEGINIGEQGIVGLITYMRTDSVNLAAEALDSIRQMIRQHFGEKFCPAQPRYFKTRSRNAQEAHEAIRITDPNLLPKTIQNTLTDEQAKLYQLIWQRSVACQMQHALLNTVAIELTAGQGHRFRATGSQVASPGFMAVYRDSQEEKENANQEKLPPLPAVESGDTLPLRELVPDQHFTEPPPRYGEASLVKSLEEHSIGRPSTYAPIISVLVQREYVELRNKRFYPTDVGRVVNQFLTDYFATYVDYDFTARLEDDLDAIARGEQPWLPLLEKFWQPFHQQVDTIQQQVTRSDIIKARQLGTDPVSGKPVTTRIGPFGPFAQIGSKEDEEKPRFASLKREQSVETITLEEALQLFTLPRKLGETDAGESISVSIGRFGPYVRYASRFVSLGKQHDPYTIDLATAKELIEDHKQREAARTIKVFDQQNIRIIRGRFGPYLTDGKKNVRLGKEVDVDALTGEQCVELMAEKKASKAKAKTTKAAAKPKAKSTATKKTTTTTKATAAKKTTKAAAKPKATAAKKTTKTAAKPKATKTKAASESD